MLVLVTEVHNGESQNHIDYRVKSFNVMKEVNSVRPSLSIKPVRFLLHTAGESPGS